MKKQFVPKMYHSKLESIIKFRKHHTRVQTAEKFKLTPERIRQIEQQKTRKRCLIHERFYYNKCSYCLTTSYKKFLSFMPYQDLEVEIDREAKNKSRDFLSVQRRIYLIEILHNKYNRPFNEIAPWLKRDRSTIIYLYNKYIKK